jgi:HD superfamily phosphohydrolase
VLQRGTPQSIAPPFVREIICGTIGADLLDYLKRDAYHCGLPQRYDERLYRYFRLVNGHLVFDLQHRGLFRPDALSELVNLLRLRYNLTERVYYHHAKIAAGAMISKALELALRAERLDEEELWELRDDTFLYLLHERCKDFPAVTGLLEDFFSRRLCVRAYLLSVSELDNGGLDRETQLSLERRFHWNEDGERERVEQEIEDSLCMPPGSVLIYCPSAQMALKEAEMLVRLPSGEVRSLSEMDVPEVDVLCKKHQQLWRLYVLIRRGQRAMAARCAARCEELFGRPNMLPTEHMTSVGGS